MWTPIWLSVSWITIRGESYLNTVGLRRTFLASADFRIKRQSLDSLSKVRNDVRFGRIFICRSATITEYDAIVCTPSIRVAGKLPGRTLPTEIRLISDVRIGNNFCDEIDYPTCENPPLVDIAQRVGSLDRNFPWRPRRLIKRDSGDAFKRAATRPACVCILRTEFPGEELGPPRDIVVWRSACPVGRSASPGYFQPCARLVTTLQCAYRPVSPLVGNIHLKSHMFAGEAMIVDVFSPLRLEQAAQNSPPTRWDIAATLCWGMGPLVRRIKG